MSNIRTKPSNPKYRDGHDRVFGERDNSKPNRKSFVGFNYNVVAMTNPEITIPMSQLEYDLRLFFQEPIHIKLEYSLGHNCNMILIGPIEFTNNIDDKEGKAYLRTGVRHFISGWLYQFSRSIHKNVFALPSTKGTRPW